ncbi:hypothetical protein AVEN_154823-1 [Araneus ventricosus]|uniref:GAG-pre-integrase domain-containing protein n=1 Tax=Araneus ventricosus TaxID=182803 RepID=A0A4Y2BT94_ARAVE|nr:hypothetical protein AVEN_154823-1 [Araneus ventricosus]
MEVLNDGLVFTPVRHENSARLVVSLMAVTIETGYRRRNPFIGDKNGCYLSKDGCVRLVGKRTSIGLYALKLKVLMSEKSADVLMAVADTMQLWDERLCHQNKHHFKSIMKQHGIYVSATTDFCEGCILGKQHRETFETRKNQLTVTGEQINADVCGPMQKISLRGSRFYASRMTLQSFSKYSSCARSQKLWIA